MIQITLYNLIHGPEIWLGIAGVSGILAVFLVLFMLIWLIRRRNPK